jgi:hypothetical protein
VAVSTLAVAHGALLTVLVVVSFVLAAVLGTALGFGLLAALLGAPVLILAGAAWLFRKALRREQESPTARKDSPV